MTNKNVDYCMWCEDVATLDVYFDVELAAGDKTELDTIITNNS